MTGLVVGYIVDGALGDVWGGCGVSGICWRRSVYGVVLVVGGVVLTVFVGGGCLWRSVGDNYRL